MNAPKPGRAARGGGLPAGVGAALFAAALFGAGTPLAKSLMAGVGPWMLAGLLRLALSVANGRGCLARYWPAASSGRSC
jgi:drug/metabolite transporter (DMT)-like permease